MSRNPFLTAVPVLALLTTLTACAGSTEETAEPAAASPAGKPATSRPATATTTRVPVKGECAAADLAVSISPQQTGETDELGMVIITNNGRRNCTVKGWLTLALHNAAGEPVDVPTQNVNEPGAPTTVKIQKGGSAFAGIKWTQCDKSDAACGVGNAIGWSLDGTVKDTFAELDSLPDPEQNTLTMKALKVGTFQPVRQGVVAW
ncbi:DUF4232 domain-containing protein [Actinoplanes derwentensis]|uniref:DUF4232 domain-containing protein n=1 Tax=Actinoplanes derwentensis TaxID=113562 RepID=A0A1H1UC51_9ACTN|nr:DUF4232 domain-containing protein [Actinoplanes derwentensis]GID85263.1 hypothetical protein Ade03nite_41870 [Actinoplanes derwentensis]SDS70008.1 Protein of unknown function [Actinoplanes derwentensis]